MGVGPRDEVAGPRDLGDVAGIIRPPLNIATIIFYNIYRTRHHSARGRQLSHPNYSTMKFSGASHIFRFSLQLFANRSVLFAAIPTVLLILPARGQDASTNSGAGSSGSCPVAGYFGNWFDRVTRIQAEQPRWVTPLVTVTPRLEEELRYDQMWESLAGGHNLTSFGGGGGKGLELIPFNPVEVIIGIPSWTTENTTPQKHGWSDESFLVKYRLLSANKENGDYILTAFMGLTTPDGSANFTGRHFVYAPTIAGGKGFGNFDVQSTLGISIPDNGASHSGTGTPLLWNTAFQYHAWKYLWPEVEANYTWWPNGKREGINQLYLTPGLLLGRIPIAGRLGLTVGAGCQVAVSDNPTYHRNVIVSARLPF